ncbi:MAG: hypothetical protein JSV12_05090 [Candidatus Bathyarchaeota archaeon]|nr:MAG: hypothetical protein JSV12_05090 [Candidatus Bathyarchaeota archaeon]
MRKQQNLVIFRSLLLFLILEFFLHPTLPMIFSGTSSNGVAKSLVFTESQPVSSGKPVFQKGMSYTTWSSNAYNGSDSDESLRLLTETNTEWVAIAVFWYQTNISSHDIHADPERTPTNESVAHAISQAHNLGLKVMLKPMLDPLESEGPRLWPVWRGEIPPSDEWFESYSSFINFFAEFAEQNDVELFSVGCELKETTREKQQWENIVSGVRERYSGPLTYAADWSNFQNIEWWDSLDYVGIDAYFPLSLLKYDPTFEELKNAWIGYAKEIETWQSTVDKPIIFTEIGYRSGDGTNMTPGNYWTDFSVDLQEQVDCYEAAFQTLWNESWFYGFYWWNWDTNPNAGGSDDTDYTPQNKPVQDVVTQWYSLSRRVLVIDETFVTVERSGVNKDQWVGFHVSWEHNDTDVVEAKVYVNGTEHVTNRTGWASFSASYDTVGNRSWTVTDVRHPEANCYKETVVNPYIIWDKTEIAEVNVDTTTFGVLKVSVNVVYVFDETSVTGATTIVNGKLCGEIESGVYECTISTWNPYQSVTVHVEHSNLSRTTKTISTAHTMNIVLYLTAVITATSIAALLVAYVYKRSIFRRS